MEKTEEAEEKRALLANDIRVLVSQLNVELEEAVRQGMLVEVQSGVRFSPMVCPVVSVQIWSEVQ